MDHQPIWTDQSSRGTLDGDGAGDHNLPYEGYRAYQFNTRQRARLLQLRSELLDARLGHGAWAQDVVPSR